MRNLFRRSAAAREEPQGLTLFAPPVDRILLQDAGDRPAWAVAKPGTWRAMFGPSLVTIEKLQTMAASYNPAELDAAAINFDHKWGGPAHGWVAEAFVRDDMLWVVPRQLSPEMEDGIRSGRWQRASMEIDTDYEPTGDWYLSGLAILGNAQPAIKGLPKITLAQNRYVLHLSAEPDPPPPADPESTENPGDDPAAPAAPPEPTTPEGDPVHEDDTDPAAPVQETPPTEEPAETQLAAARTRADEATRRADEATRRAETAAQRAELRAATAEVEADLRELANHVPPGVLRHGIREALIQLRSAPQATTIRLAERSPEGTETQVDRPLADVILATLRALPDIYSQLSSELVTEDPAAPDAWDRLSTEQRAMYERRNIDRTRYTALAAKYPRMRNPSVN